MFNFGTGLLYANPVGGNQATNPTPQLIATVQDVSLDITCTLKELVGQNQFPDDVAPGEKKISGKFQFGRINLDVFNNLFFADTRTTGVKQITGPEAHAVPASPGPYTVTVSGSANFTTDLGVRYSATGQPLNRVASGPLAGQYSVSAGIYTFAAADQGSGVSISYVQTVSGSGYTVQINQQLMGYGPVFELWLAETYQAVSGVPNGIHLYACRLSKLAQALKNTDYTKPEMDYMSFANAAGQIGEMFQVAA